VSLRWVASTEVCASANNRVAGMVHNDSAIRGEWTGTALLKESLVGLEAINTRQ
jgi:hypothetical protein